MSDSGSVDVPQGKSREVIKRNTIVTGDGKDGENKFKSHATAFRGLARAANVFVHTRTSIMFQSYRIVFSDVNSIVR